MWSCWWLAFWVGGMSTYLIWFLGGEKFDRFVDFFAPNIDDMIPNLTSISLNWIESIIHTHTLIYNGNDLINTYKIRIIMNTMIIDCTTDEDNRDDSTDNDHAIFIYIYMCIHHRVEFMLFKWWHMLYVYIDFIHYITWSLFWPSTCVFWALQASLFLTFPISLVVWTTARGPLQVVFGAFGFATGLVIPMNFVQGMVLL